MKRCKGVAVRLTTADPDKDRDWYKQFQIIVLGLDSIEVSQRCIVAATELAGVLHPDAPHGPSRAGPPLIFGLGMRHGVPSPVPTMHVLPCCCRRAVG